MSAICRLATLLAGLRYLRVRAKEPGCWLLTLPSIRKHAQADAERDALFSRLRGSYRSAVWVLPAEAEDEFVWRVVDKDLPIPAEVHESYGDWALLLFARAIPEFHPPLQLKLGIKCQDLQEALRLADADVIIVSLPDDIEWMVAGRA